MAAGTGYRPPTPPDCTCLWERVMFGPGIKAPWLRCHIDPACTYDHHHDDGGPEGGGVRELVGAGGPAPIGGQTQ